MMLKSLLKPVHVQSPRWGRGVGHLHVFFFNGFYRHPAGGFLLGACLSVNGRVRQ